MRLFEVLGSGLSYSGVFGSGCVHRSASTLGKRLNRDSAVNFAVFLSLGRAGSRAGALLLFGGLLITHGESWVLFFMQESEVSRDTLGVKWGGKMTRWRTEGQGDRKSERNLAGSRWMSMYTDPTDKEEIRQEDLDESVGRKNESWLGGNGSEFLWRWVWVNGERRGALNNYKIGPSP
jgi:hypothetical protein